MDDRQVIPLQCHDPFIGHPQILAIQKLDRIEGVAEGTAIGHGGRFRAVHETELVNCLFQVGKGFRLLLFKRAEQLRRSIIVPLPCKQTT